MNPPQQLCATLKNAIPKQTSQSASGSLMSLSFVLVARGGKMRTLLMFCTYFTRPYPSATSQESSSETWSFPFMLLPLASFEEFLLIGTLHNLFPGLRIIFFDFAKI
jgi:hypothetical protein